MNETQLKFFKLSKRIAKGKKGALLSKEYINSQTKMEWKCSCGYIWDATYANISRGKWCPRCAGKIVGIEDVIERASLKGLKVLSNKYTPGNRKYKFECPIGHTFSMTFTKLKHQGCPECAKGVGERIVRAYFEKCFNRKFPTRRGLDWFKSKSGGYLELDGYCEELAIAFEHHGLQHYNDKNLYIKSKYQLDRRKEMDELKRHLCKKNGVILIEVPQVNNLISLKELPHFLYTEFVKKIKIDFKDPRRVKVDFSSVYSPDKLKKHQADVKKLNLECLSKEWKGTRHKMRYRCLVCGHERSIAPTSLHGQTRGCPKCANNLKIDIKEARNRGLKNGLTLISKEIKNNKEKLKWRCNSCNEFIYVNLDKASTARSCKKCANRETADRCRMSESDLKKKLKKYDIIPIGSYVNSKTGVDVKCLKCGYEFNRQLNSIRRVDPKKSIVCPSCRKK